MATSLDFVKEFIASSKDKIVELASTELENKQKKNVLDTYITNLVKDATKTMKLGWIANLVIKHWLIPNISVFTQYIYDLLKVKIKQL